MEDKSLPIFIADFSQNQEEEELETDEDSDEDEDNLVNQILSPPKNRRQMKKDNLILKQNRKQMHSPNTNKYESKTRKPQYFNSAYNIENSSEQDFSDSLQKLQEDFNKKSRTEPFTAPASVPDRFWPDPITSDSGNAREQEKMRIENMLTEAMRGQKWSLSEPLSASLGSLAPNYSSKIPHQPIKNPQSNPKKSKKENIWKELFNHLDLNDNLCKEEDLDDKIHKIKSSISKKLNKIVNKNYMPNKNELNLELKLIAKNLLDYSKLFRNTKSLDLLLYLNSILQDKLTCSQNIERIYLNSQIDEGLKREQGEKIWKELFYYFEFNDNSTNEFEINERIRKIRSEIPQKINNILTVNYSSIKNEMDFEIRYSMKSFLDYSNLYGNKRYMDRLCYLNLLVQEKLNSIHNIERLYPSIRSLKQDQVDYSDPKFESSAKSLLLWNKIVEDLMVKSDQLGIFLGFKKHPEYLEHWNWFEPRLSYSREEYEKVQEWLNKSLNQSDSSSTLVNSTNEQIASPKILLTKPTFCETKSAESNFLTFRQISFLLKRQKSHDNQDDETVRSSLSVNFFSDRNSPESILQPDHLMSARIQHVNSFFIEKHQSYVESVSLNEKVKFSLDDSEDDLGKTEPEIEPCESENFESVSCTGISETSVNPNRKKLFRDFLRKRLRKFGLTQTCDKIRQVLLNSLTRALLALQTNKCERSALNNMNDYQLVPLHYKFRELLQKFFQDEESMNYGVHSETFKKLGLPTFRPLFIYLNNVILDLMHTCIEMQNENKGEIKFGPDFKFSLLSIEVMTNECRECIEQAILVRQFYYHMIYSVFDHDELDVQKTLDTDLYSFDEELKKTINIYLNFITDWVQDLVRISNLDKALCVLENEWNFCKNNLYFVTASEDTYASRFCVMSNHIYGSLIHMFSDLETKFKEPLRSEIDNIGWNENFSSEDTEYESLRQMSNVSTLNLEELNLKFNDYKQEINKLRKFCLRTLEFSSEFVSDLELAAKYEVLTTVQDLLDRLKASNHVMINFTNEELSSESSFLIFVPQEFAKDKIQIVRLLFIISEKDEFESPDDHENIQIKEKTTNSPKSFRRLSSSNSIFDPYSQIDSTLKKLSEFAQKMTPVKSGRSSPIQMTPNSFIISPQHNSDVYLLYLHLAESKNDFKWTGQTIELYASHAVRRSLYQYPKMTSDTNLNFLYLVTSKQSILNQKKSHLKQKLKGSIKFIKDKASFHPSIDESINDLKDKIFELRNECIDSIASVEIELQSSSQNSETSESFVKVDENVNEILRVWYTFGIELQNEIIKFITQDRIKAFAEDLAEFSIQWCEYIVNKTPIGKGRNIRPWSANKGLQLVQAAISQSDHIEYWKFSSLLKSVEKCIKHLIGEPTKKSLGIPHTTQRRLSFNYSVKKVDNKVSRRKKFEESCLERDKEREEVLLEDRLIGKILDINRQDSVITGSEVQFRWQLGLLIGEGSFGKVYSCVNLDTCEPMALKIIEFRNNTDATKVREIADEINNVVDINHENLVRVYGCELHRKEILIFMEFCGDQCTLQRLSRDSSGLPEHLVRDFTKSLVKGVEYLHERNVMHRDIKGANVFLKSIDYKHPEKVVLKLGDFGCSIRLKDPIGNESRDQATGLRGTYAFMAPEVMTSGESKDAGYTYSADIWSVGCVVIEMFTGKMPWHPLKDGQIMFEMHISPRGQRKPQYPSPISDEAVNFLNCCLEFDPKNRKTAEQLLEHNFVKILDQTFE